MHDSRSNSDKLDKISFLEMLTLFSKITLAVLNIFILFRTTKSVKCPIKFLMYSDCLYVISIQNYDVIMYVSFARILPFTVDIFTLRMDPRNLLGRWVSRNHPDSFFLSIQKISKFRRVSDQTAYRPSLFPTFPCWIRGPLANTLWFCNRLCCW